VGVEFVAQALAESVALLEVYDLLVIHPLHHLLGAKFLASPKPMKNASSPARSRSNRLVTGWMALSLVLYPAGRQARRLTSIAERNTRSRSWRYQRHPNHALRGIDAVGRESRTGMVPAAKAFFPDWLHHIRSRCLSTAFSPSRGPESLPEPEIAKIRRSAP
jgi:hypothetical protein